jgi:hypothetical protein
MTVGLIDCGCSVQLTQSLCQSCLAGDTQALAAAQHQGLNLAGQAL